MLVGPMREAFGDGVAADQGGGARHPRNRPNAPKLWYVNLDPQTLEVVFPCTHPSLTLLPLLFQGKLDFWFLLPTPCCLDFDVVGVDVSTASSDYIGHQQTLSVSRAQAPRPNWRSPRDSPLSSRPLEQSFSTIAN